MESGTSIREWVTLIITLKSPLIAATSRIVCSQSPIFHEIVDVDRWVRCAAILVSWFERNWGEYKMPWLGVVEGTPPLPHAFNPITPTHRHYVPLPVSVASRDQDGGQSDSTTDIYDLTENVNSLPPGGFKSQKNNSCTPCMPMFLHRRHGRFIVYQFNTVSLVSNRDSKVTTGG